MLLALCAACGGKTGGASAPTDAGASDSSQGDNGGVVDCVEAGGTCFVGNLVFCMGAVNPLMTCPGPGEVARCCLPGNVDCGQPDAATIACSDTTAPHPPEVTCEGFPIVKVFGAFAILVGYEEDAGVAAGCNVTFPLCSNGMRYQCQCGQDGGWGCGEAP